jgi:P-type conjugative transfer protein TrbJ
MFTRTTILAAKTVALATTLFFVSSQPALAGIPVADGLNLSQTTVTAINQVAQVTKQIQQYKTQLEQYENMLQNTATPSAYVWNDVNGIINNLVSAQQSLNYYKNQAGSIDKYLEKYQNVTYYEEHPCFNNKTGCTAQQRIQLENSRAEGADAVKRANADVIRSVDQQQQTLASDAQKLQQLQGQASSATGQMQALQAANQLAGAQGNQLIQIRSMLMAQNQAATTIAQQQADQKAQESAAAKMLRDESNIKRTTPSKWSMGH